MTSSNEKFGNSTRKGKFSGSVIVETAVISQFPMTGCIVGAKYTVLRNMDAQGHLRAGFFYSMLSVDIDPVATDQGTINYRDLKSSK
jgi:hypothetical protein